MPHKPDLHTTCPHLIWSPRLDQPPWFPLSAHYITSISLSLNNEVNLVRCKATSLQKAELLSFHRIKWMHVRPLQDLSLLGKISELQENKLLGFEMVKPPHWQKQWKDVTQQEDKALDFADNLDISELCLQILKETGNKLH